jgi:hypothetical protein
VLAGSSGHAGGPPLDREADVELCVAEPATSETDEGTFGTDVAASAASEGAGTVCVVAATSLPTADAVPPCCRPFSSCTVAVEEFAAPFVVGATAWEGS